MILQHLAGTAQDFEAICETIGKVQRLAKGPGDAPRADGRREKEVHLASAENGSGDFNGVCGYCKKKAGHKRKDCPVRKAKQSGSGSGLGLGRNVVHVARMDTLMLNVGKNSLIKLLNGTRI